MRDIGRIALFLLVLRAMSWTAQAPDGEAILRRVDDNMGSDNKITVSEMIIHGRRGSRSVRAKSWISGRIKSLPSSCRPAARKGTKMLKLQDQLWTYAPSTDRTILISGHMLRQSVMGSDLSYEDLLEDPALPASMRRRSPGRRRAPGVPAGSCT